MEVPRRPWCRSALRIYICWWIHKYIYCLLCLFLGFFFSFVQPKQWLMYIPPWLADVYTFDRVALLLSSSLLMSNTISISSFFNFFFFPRFVLLMFVHETTCLVAGQTPPRTPFVSLRRLYLMVCVRKPQPSLYLNLLTSSSFSSERRRQFYPLVDFILSCRSNVTNSQDIGYL